MIKEAAAQFRKSTRTIQRWLKQGKLVAKNGKYQFALQPVGGTNPTQVISTNLPPGGGKFSVPSVQQHTGVITGGKRFYVPSDLAIITNRENARVMYNNLVIRESLQSRLWAAAEQAGHVEPEDPKDKRQLKIAAEIQKVIDNIPDFLKMKYALLKSRWFGCYATMLKYEWKGRKLAVKDWIPVHGDSIIFAQDNDDVAVYTTIGGGVGVKPVTTEAGYIGRAHVIGEDYQIEYDERGLPFQRISTHERAAFILMTYDPDPSDFLDIRRAGAVKGLGIRSTIYPTWYAAQEILGNLMDWLERIGTGLTIYKFLRGNEASYNAAKELAESQSNQAVMLIPVDPEVAGGKPVEGVERIEPSAVGLDNMVRVIEDLFNSQIRRFIVGQDSTSRPVSSGLNSNLADIHENTFSRIVAFDCQDLAQCLTHQLVKVLHEWNFPDDQDFTCKYVIDYDSSDVDKQINAIRAAYEMGVHFDEDEVRSLTGLSKPDLDAMILHKDGASQQQQGQPAEQEGTEEQAETAATGELAQTVGGLQAIAALQGSYYEGKIPQEACINNVVLLFGFSPEQAASLFPEIPPEKLTEDEGAGGFGEAPPEEAPPEEGMELFRYDWSPYVGPAGGKGWQNDKGDIVYGDKPGGNKKNGGTKTEKVEGWASKIKKLPAAVAKKAKDKAQNYYGKLSGRYGKKMAIAIMAAGVAGIPVPLPGASFIAAAPVIAVAELVRHFSPAKAMMAEPTLTPEQIAKLGRKLMKKMIAEWKAEEGHQFEAEVDPDVQLLAVAEILSSDKSDEEKRGAVYAVLGKEAD